MSIPFRCWLFGHDHVATVTKWDPPGSNITRYAQCTRCGHTVHFEQEEDS